MRQSLGNNEESESNMKCIFLILLLIPLWVSAQNTSNDYFPLRVGNSWTYTYYTSFYDQMADYHSSDKGVATYTIISSSSVTDSILWKFQEVRNIIHNYQHTFPPLYDTSYSIMDTSLFVIIEYQTTNHEFLIPSENPQKYILPYIFLQKPFSDSLQFSRYSSEVTQDTLMLAWEWPKNYIGSSETYYSASASFQKSVGLIRGSYSNSPVGTLDHGYDTLLNAIITSVKQNRPDELPRKFTLNQNYPNPFNPVTVIPFTLSARSKTTIRIYDILGRLVETVFSGSLEAGGHSVIWNAIHHSSGMYLCVVQINDESKSIKLVLLK
jgi:hypothetical protein